MRDDSVGGLNLLPTLPEFLFQNKIKFRQKGMAKPFS